MKARLQVQGSLASAGGYGATRQYTGTFDAVRQVGILLKDSRIKRGKHKYALACSAMHALPIAERGTSLEHTCLLLTSARQKSLERTIASAFRYQKRRVSVDSTVASLL